MVSTVKSIYDIKENWQVFDDIRHINGLFLYKYEEKNIAYHARMIVRAHYHFFIDRPDEEFIFYFLMEKPVKESLKSSWKEKLGFNKEKGYWEGIESHVKLHRHSIKHPRDDDIWSDLINVVPYDDATLYRIADSFKIPIEYVPCIVYFPSIKKSDILVIPLDNSWPDTFFYDFDYDINQSLGFTKKQKIDISVWEDFLDFSEILGKYQVPLWKKKKPYKIKLPSSVGTTFEQILLILLDRYY